LVRQKSIDAGEDGTGVAIGHRFGALIAGAAPTTGGAAFGRTQELLAGSQTHRTSGVPLVHAVQDAASRAQVNVLLRPGHRSMELIKVEFDVVVAFDVDSHWPPLVVRHRQDADVVRSDTHAEQAVREGHAADC
jgi:hypothetical protein